METMQSHHHRRNDRCDAISDLIPSVAEEQEALARILEAEHAKIKKATELCRTDVDDLVKIDKRVELVLAALTRLEQALDRALRAALSAQEGLL